MKEISKLLVIKLDHIGDLVLTIPALKALRKRYPNIQLDVMVNPKSQAVIQELNEIDHIYLYDSRDFDRDDHIEQEGLGRNISTIHKIRCEKYDICIGLREDLSNIPIQLMCGAKENVSFSTNTQFAGYLDQSVENDESKHAARIQFDLLKKLDVEMPKILVPEVPVSKDGRLWAEQFLLEQERGNVSVRIGLSIGGGWFLNWWPVENYVRLAAKIKHTYPDAEIILVGGSAEKKLEKSFQKIADFDYISAIGKADIGQMCALYEKMDLVVSNDGGPMHMATAVKTTVIALFGPSPYQRFGPLGSDNIIITKKYPCSPCPQFVKGQAPHCQDNQCMKAITVEEVYQAVVAKMERTGG